MALEEILAGKSWREALEIIAQNITKLHLVQGWRAVRGKNALASASGCVCCLSVEEEKKKGFPSSHFWLIFHYVFMFYQEKLWKQLIELCADGNFQSPS